MSQRNGNKNVLLFMPCFFNYYNIIIAELKKQGYQVYFVENKLQKLDFSSPLAKFQIVRKVYHRFTDIKWKYSNKSIDWNVKYDIFIVVNGFSYDKRIIEKLRKINSRIDTILYLWDSTKMFSWPGIEKDFDKSFTFDPIDAAELGIGYLANFYHIGVELCTEKPTIDLFFVGTQHADRFDVIEKIYACIDNKQVVFIKLLVKYRNAFHSKYLYSFLKKMKNTYARNYVLNYELVERKKKADFLIFDAISTNVIEEQMRKSRCVLDIQSPYQVGLPHQLIKALAMGKKIITTNKWIVNYDFYSPKNILVIDRLDPVIDTDFLLNDYFAGDLVASVKNSRVDKWIEFLLS